MRAAVQVPQIAVICIEVVDAENLRLGTRVQNALSWGKLLKGEPKLVCVASTPRDMGPLNCLSTTFGIRFFIRILPAVVRVLPACVALDSRYHLILH